MNAYHFLYIITLCNATLCMQFKSIKAKINNKIIEISNLFYGVLALVLILFAGFIGDVTADHMNYVRAFNEIRILSLSDFLVPKFKIKYMEKGFGLLIWIIGRFTENPMWIFIISAALIVLPIVWLGKQSKDPVLYIALFLSVGYYFAGLNVIRQAIVASLFIIAVRYIRDGEVWKYSCAILLLSTIQISALSMLPFYYLLRQTKSLKRTILHMGVVAIFFSSTYKIISFIDNMFFNNKYIMTGRVSVVHPPIKIVAPLMIFILCRFILLLWSINNQSISYRELTPNKISNKSVSMAVIGSNASYYWILFWIMTLKFAYFERMTYFFFPLVGFAITRGISQYENAKVRAFLKFGVLVLISIYYFVFGQYPEVYNLSF